MPATPLPDPTPHDRLIAAAREWLARSWGRRFARVALIFADDSAVELAPQSTDLRVRADGTILFGRPIDKTLFDAARAWGEHQRGEYPQTLRIIAADGSWAFLDVPPSLPGNADLVPDPPHFEGAEQPAGPAWVVDDVSASYKGRRFAVRGKRQKLLKALADRAGDEVPNGDLKEAVWGDRHFDDQQFRSLVSRLRSLLAAVLDVGGETILACGGAHKLLPT